MIALLVIAVVAIMLTGILQRLLVRNVGMEVSVAVHELDRVTTGYRAVARAELWQHLTDLDSSPLPAELTHAPTPGSPWRADPSKPFTWAIPTDGAFVSEPTYVTGSGPLTSLIRYAPYFRSFTYSSIVGFTGTFSGMTTERSVPMTFEFFEVPTYAFQLVATDAPLDLDGSCTFEVVGTALLNGGSTGTRASTVSDGVFVPGRAASTLAKASTSERERVSWGTDTVNLLSPTVLSTAGRIQSYAQSDGVTVINYPAAGSPPDPLTLLEFGGQNYLAIDLNTYSGPANIFINAQDSGAAIGVIIFGGGDSSEALDPVVVAGTCRFTLVGSNKRPMILVSNIPSLSVYSHIDLNTGLPAAGSEAIETHWRGYFHLPVTNLTFHVNQPWTLDSIFSLHGALAVKGGSVAFVDDGTGGLISTLKVARDTVLEAKLLPSGVHKDRFLLVPKL